MDCKKSISIVIPNYNGRHLLREYLPFTIEAIKNADINYEIIIVDDCSLDDSINFVRLHYPQITLIINKENNGFSYSCNRGIEAAQYELILLLNSDVKLNADYFEHQWKYFSKPDTFGVMGRIIDMQGDRIQDAARMPKFNGLKLKTDYFYYTKNDDGWLYTFYLSGANALIDAAKLKQIGGFYELFSPFYCEDMELSIRAWKLNWKCYYEHNSVCRHLLSATTKNYKTPKWVKKIYFRNRFYLHAIHLNGWGLIAWYIQLTFVDLLPKLFFGQIWIWKSYMDLYKGQDDIKEYKSRVTKLMDEHQTNVSMFDILKKIRQSVKKRKIIKFDPK